jgi:hypothetical protein
MIQSRKPQLLHADERGLERFTRILDPLNPRLSASMELR